MKQLGWIRHDALRMVQALRHGFAIFDHLDRMGASLPPFAAGLSGGSAVPASAVVTACAPERFAAKGMPGSASPGSERSAGQLAAFFAVSSAALPTLLAALLTLLAASAIALFLAFSLAEFWLNK